MEIWFSSNIILLSFPCVLIILLPGDSLLLHQQLVSLHVVKQFYSIAFVCVHIWECMYKYVYMSMRQASSLNLERTDVPHQQVPVIILSLSPSTGLADV